MQRTNDEQHLAALLKACIRYDLGHDRVTELERIEERIARAERIERSRRACMIMTRRMQQFY